MHLLREPIRIRRFEERCVELYSATKSRGFLHLYIGEEAAAVGVMQALTEDDAVVATYREHGHALARGVPAAAVIAEMYGKVEGTSRGRGGSMHIFDRARRFYGGHAIVGGGLHTVEGSAPRSAGRVSAGHWAQVALIGFGRIVERPWASGGLLGVRPLVRATLSADHRVSDGQEGARFLAVIERLLGAPETL